MCFNIFTSIWIHCFYAKTSCVVHSLIKNLPLALPSLFTLICFVVGGWGVIARVSVEERLLRERFGAEYESYSAHTPRWLSFP
jgi:protein-S-isoprenylcysteine O-methyltransferase Ste14